MNQSYINDAVEAVQEEKKKNAVRYYYYYTRLNRKDKGRYLAVFLRVEPQPTGNRLTLSLPRSDRV